MRTAAAFLLGLLLSSLLFAGQAERTFPFTEEENQDGAKFVWFMFDRVNLGYDYVTARELPKSDGFRVVYFPRTGDVAWWPEFVAIVKVGEEKQLTYLTAESERAPEEIEDRYGKPVFYRRVVIRK
ncbi:MAG: hypothetical protein MUE46_12915 [Xanthomonadales bacterium]|jgi:hypothetical protein|nr:hypothetical protein [Xanthomonadales bacterium]